MVKNITYILIEDNSDLEVTEGHRDGEVTEGHSDFEGHIELV